MSAPFPKHMFNVIIPTAPVIFVLLTIRQSKYTDALLLHSSQPKRTFHFCPLRRFYTNTLSTALLHHFKIAPRYPSGMSST